MVEREDQSQEEPEEKAQEESKEQDRFVPSEQREEFDSTRRLGEERRQVEEPPPDGEERRETPERRGEVNRRKMTYGIVYKTAGGMTQIEDWMDDQCQGDWSLVLADMDDDLVKKTFRVMFELETDKTNFIENFIKS